VRQFVTAGAPEQWGQWGQLPPENKYCGGRAPTTSWPIYKFTFICKKRNIILHMYTFTRHRCCKNWGGYGDKAPKNRFGAPVHKQFLFPVLS